MGWGEKGLGGGGGVKSGEKKRRRNEWRAYGRER